MSLRRITLLVLICQIVAFGISIARFASHPMAMTSLMSSHFVALLLRDVSLIVFFAYLYRRS